MTPTYRGGDMRVYYTGDVANFPGWFSASPVNSGFGFTLTEELGGEDRTLHVSAAQIGRKYEGHCNPRFVTEEAYKAFYASRQIA